MPRTRRTSPKGKTQRFSPRPGAHSPVLVEDHHVEPLVRVHRSLRWTRWPRRGEVLSRTLRDDLSDLKKKKTGTPSIRNSSWKFICSRRFWNTFTFLSTSLIGLADVFFGVFSVAAYVFIRLHVHHGGPLCLIPLVVSDILVEQARDIKQASVACK